MKKSMLLLLFLFTQNNFAYQDCRMAKGIRVLSQATYHEYNYNGTDHELVTKDKRFVEVYEVWSEVAGELHEVYFETMKNKMAPNQVVIEYYFNDEQKYNRTIPMSRFKGITSKNLVYKIDDFTFKDGVLEKDFRPGVQSFHFFKGKEPICTLKVQHIFAEEDN